MAQFERIARLRLFSLFILCLLNISIASLAVAQVSSELAPVSCTGYIEENNSWYGAISGKNNSLYCPANYAVYGTSKIVGSRLNFRGIHIPINCCPLPAKNILGEEKIFVEGVCPEDFVVTGVKDLGPCFRVPIISLALCSKDQGYLLQCTKVNTDKYALSRPEPGIFWGFASNEYAEGKIVFKKTIPEPIRSAIGRKGKYTWGSAGCIGSPAGSLLTGREGKRCKHLQFKSLMLRTNAGETRAVPMFPKQ